MGVITGMTWRLPGKINFLPPVCFVSLFLLLCSCSSKPTKDQLIVGTVTRVHDGDSIHITPKTSNRVVIRLAGIDAPEIKQTFGIQSRDKLRSLILNKTAQAHCHKLDKYQRHVCVVRYENKDINLQMVAAGMAWHYKQYQNEQSVLDRRRYAAAQTSAQKRQLGLWGMQAVAPWEFRQAQQ